jgi:NADH dehydrogenase
MSDISKTRPKVVIVGAGFGGLYAAKRLVHAQADVTLIDRQNHHLFQPLLYQVATAALAPSDIATPIRAVFTAHKNIRVVMGDVTGVDTAARRVQVRDTGDFPYDILVLATGAATSWFGHADWARASAGLKSLDEAEAIRLRLLGAFEWAESRTDPREIARLLTCISIRPRPA